MKTKTRLMAHPPRTRGVPVKESGSFASTVEFSTFLYEMPILLDTFNEDGLIGFWNRECERLTGYKSAEIVNNPDALRVLYPDKSYLADLLANCERRGPSQVWCLRAKNGESRSIAWTNIPAATEGWEWGFGIDLTDRIRLTSSLDGAAETERRRLGMELHDGLGQTLTGLAFMIQSLSERRSLREHAVAGEVKQIAKLASSAVKTCREIAAGLFPAREGGLCAALRSLVLEMQYQFMDMQITFEESGGAEVKVGEGAIGHLYRIVQEAVNNAIRHSMGDRIRVVCCTSDDMVTLLIEDNGKGLSKAQIAGRGLGMRTLRDRAAAIDAVVFIESSIRHGTTVRVECPNTDVGEIRFRQVDS